MDWSFFVHLIFSSRSKKWLQKQTCILLDVSSFEDQSRGSSNEWCDMLVINMIVIIISIDVRVALMIVKSDVEAIRFLREELCSWWDETGTGWHHSYAKITFLSADRTTPLIFFVAFIGTFMEVFFFFFWGEKSIFPT